MKQRLVLRRPAEQEGVTLVELMVAVTIGLIVTLAVTSVLTISEAHRRSTTATNDMNQSGSFAAYQLDRIIRSAGSAIWQSANVGVIGCKLNVGSILPRDAAFPAPFNTRFLTGKTADLRIAPLLIGKSMSDDGKSDVLVIMGANANAGGVPRRVNNPGSDALLKLENSVGFSANDALLVSQPGNPDCLMEQTTSVDNVGAPGDLNLGGSLYTSGATTSIATFAASTDTFVTPLGNPSGGSLRFRLFGVGENHTLFSYDLLRGRGVDESEAVTDGVQEIHAVYGLDTDEDGIINTWANPGTTGFKIDEVMVDPVKIRQIVAVRLALVLRNSKPERDEVTPECDGLPGTAEAACAPYRYFSDITASGVSLTGEVDTKTDASLRKLRLRVIETTIPLHNLQLQPSSL